MSVSLQKVTPLAVFAGNAILQKLAMVVFYIGNPPHKLLPVQNHTVKRTQQSTTAALGLNATHILSTPVVCLLSETEHKPQARP